MEPVREAGFTFAAYTIPRDIKLMVPCGETGVRGMRQVSGVGYGGVVKVQVQRV